MAREAPRIRLYLGEPELLQQLVRARSWDTRPGFRK